MMTDYITLIKQTTGSVDDAGDRVLTETPKDVFCRTASVGQKEFYQAHALGLQPEIKFILTDYYDYDGETIVQHEGIRYRVLRTYRNGNELEITCTRDVNTYTPPAPTPAPTTGDDSNESA